MSRRLFNLILLVIILLGLLIRLAYLFGSPFTPDESTYGLIMAHILNGKPWPVFFYAQPYTGSQSAIIAAGLAKLIGFWPYFLKFVPLVFSVGLIWANYYLAKLVFKSKKAGLVAGLLTALLPSFAQNWSVRAGSGYPEAALVGSLCLILGLRIVFHRVKSLDGQFFLLGLLAGFGYWVQPAIVYFLIPLAFMIFLWEPKFFLKRWFYFAILGLLIGAAPVIYYNLTNNLQTGRALFNKPGGIKRAFVIFFTEGMPVILGTRPSWSRIDNFLPLAILVWGVYAAAVLAPLLKLVKRLWFWLRNLGLSGIGGIRGLGRWAGGGFSSFRRIFLESPVVLLLLVVLITPFIFAISPFNWFVVEPRYIYAPLYATLPVLLAGSVLYSTPGVGLKKGGRGKEFRLSRIPTPGVGWFGWFFLGIVLFSNTLSFVVKKPNSRPTSFEAQFDVTPVINFLREHDIKYIYSSFMFCHRLVFESKEDVICTPFEGGFGEVRYPAYKAMVDQAPKEQKGFVFLVGIEGEKQTADTYHPAIEPCKADLSKQNDPCHDQILGPFRVSWFR